MRTMKNDRISNLLVTGANGFVGQAFLDMLEEFDYNLRPNKITLVGRSDRCPRDLSNFGNSITYISADLTKTWDFDCGSAYVLNLAADGGPTSYSDTAAQDFEKINLNLSTWAIKNKPSIVVHASTGACFGLKQLQNEEIRNQDATVELLRKKRFIESRILAEKTLQKLQAEFGIPVSVCRLFSFVGKRLLEKKQYAISSFIDSAIREKRIIVKGNPKTVRSYLSEQDMSTWLWSALKLPASDEILSVGSSRGVTLGELAQYIAGQTDSSIIYENPDAFGDEYVADNLKTLDFLNVSEGKLWEESTLECIDFLRGIHERG
ncbi:WcaG Nucleoside-diphosphate-sugar epimerases [Candidatus Nanopelagicaceae bacterium]